MNPEMWVALGTVGAAFVGYLGVKYTSNQSREATRQSNTLEEKAIDAAAYERARDSYEASIANYTREVESLTNRVTSLNTRITELNSEIVVADATIREQRRQINDALDRLVRERNEYQEHLKRCQAKLATLRDRLEHNPHIRPDDPDLLFEP